MPEETLICNTKTKKLLVSRGKRNLNLNVQNRRKSGTPEAIAVFSQNFNVSISKESAVNTVINLFLFVKIPLHIVCTSKCPLEDSIYLIRALLPVLTDKLATLRE